MKKEFKLSINNLEKKYKNKKVWKKVTTILSCIVILITTYLLISPAITESIDTSYTLHLIDSYDVSVNEGYSWKTATEEKYTSNYDLKLHFMDTKGNYIEGRDITINIGPNSLPDVPYAFGYIPNIDETTSGLNLIEELNLNEIVINSGEKYIFDHAEVYIDNTWQTFLSNTGIHWNIWCQSASSITEPTSYGWRGNYEKDGNSIQYIVNDTTEYKFVFKQIRLGEKNTVSSLGSDLGISFKIFNYTGDNTETGINSNGLYNYFSFRDSSLDVPTYINSETDADGFVQNRAKVKSTLDSNGYPVFDCQEKCTNETNIKNTSLGYLFGAPTNALGTETVGVKTYNATNTPLQKEIIDEVEYYYYDSNQNAVDYDTDNNRFMVRNYLERGYIISTYEKENNRYEFLPFNYLVEDDHNKNYDYESAEDKTEIDHWYGMTMEFEFYMPKDGKLLDKDMIFSFSGDDDVWVFIDDVLVLDLGGTHGSVDGNINFSTGIVESYLNWNGVVGTVSEGTANKTSIYEMFINANRVDSVEWNTNKTTFENYTKHTLKFFYLERGAAVANCKIRFNIPVLPSGSLSVQKKFEGTEKYNENYEFTIYDVTSGTPIPKNTKYKIGEKEFYIDNNEGKFSLKNNEVAIFKLINNHTYYVEETNTSLFAVSSTCNLDGKECPKINKTQNLTINSESKYQAIFTNKIKTFNLDITKIAIDSEENELFNFKINLSDEFGTPININVLDISFPNEYNIDKTNNGIVTFSLKNEEQATLNGIPINTNVTIEETKHDGYQTIIKSIAENGEEILVANNDKYIIDKMDSNKKIKVYNTPGVVLPETGSKGTHIYFIIGICLMFFSIKYGYNYFLKWKKW